MGSITRKYVEHQLATSKRHLRTAENDYAKAIKERLPIGSLLYYKTYIAKIKRDIKFWESYLEV